MSNVLLGKHKTEEQLLTEQITFQNVRLSAYKTDLALGRKTEDKDLPVTKNMYFGKSYSSLSKDEQKKAEKAYESVKAQNTFVAASELETPYLKKVLESESKVGVKQSDLLSNVMRGDYTQMQNLDSVLRNYAATMYFQKPEVQELLKGEPADVLKKLKEKDPENPVKEMMNPMLRMAISCVINSPDAGREMKAKYKKIDELINTEIMVATIITKPSLRINGLSVKDISRNLQSQKFMFKTMLMCQLGKMRIKIKDSTPPTDRPWEGNVANAFAHCSRVMITLPGESGDDFTEAKQKKMIKSVHGTAGFFKRGGATHTMSRKRKGSAEPAKEIKFFSPRSQYGMNVAVGGLGNNGIPDAQGHDRMLKNDGSCGHLFMHFEEGTKSKHAGMLIGFESDAYGVMNQTGHVHDKKATGEFASSFGGQRCDEIGDKYGGRDADLSGLDPTAFTELMEDVEEAMSKLLNSEGDENADKVLRQMTESVCGGLMDQKAMTDLIQTIYENTKDKASTAAERAINTYQRLYHITPTTGN